MKYSIRQTEGGVPIKMWTDGVHVDDGALAQLDNLASLSFIHSHIAAMPDVHWGMGATVGSVIATKNAIIPAAVGVDIGCGMMAVKLDGITAKDLPDSLRSLRNQIERIVPVGNKGHKDGKEYRYDQKINLDYLKILTDKHPKLGSGRKHTLEKLSLSQAGTLGGGNHFYEMCLDENDEVWIMLHSGSRGVGNAIGQYFIEIAKKDMEKHYIHLPDKNLAYLTEGTSHYEDYVKAVGWAQHYAMENRNEMVRRTLIALHKILPPFKERTMVISCHHNYVEMETHFGERVMVTRKGAVRARDGDYGIIPGSMGAKSYIVRGKGNEQSFHSCSHGAGRLMSRTKAREVFTIQDHIRATKNIECRKDDGVLDETPGAYKDIDAVMEAQTDLVEIVHTLRQVMCIKG